MEEPIVPDWITGILHKAVAVNFDISTRTMAWIQRSDYLFYAFHGYSTTTAALIERVGRIQQDWPLAAFVTEGGECVIGGQVSASARCICTVAR